MGHFVEYIIDIGVDAFADGVSDVAAATSGCWEGAIPNSGGELLGQSGTSLTCMTFAAIKYSWLIGGDAHSIAAVDRMDGALRNCFPHSRIVRLDELLYGEWEDTQSPDYQNAPGSFSDLLEWLADKDCRYWSVISDSKADNNGIHTEPAVGPVYIEHSHRRPGDANRYASKETQQCIGSLKHRFDSGAHKGPRPFPLHSRSLARIAPTSRHSRLAVHRQMPQHASP